MGAWGTAVFDNDDAADFANEIEDAGTFAEMRELQDRALTTVISSDEFLDNGDAGIAAAAAALVAAWDNPDLLGERAYSLEEWPRFAETLPDALKTKEVAPAARSPEARPRLAARAGRRAGAGPHAPLRRQGAVPGARHLPGLLPVLHAQLRGRRRHRRGREGPAQGRRRALGAGVRVHRARAPSSRTSSSPAATPTSCAPSRSRRSASAARDAEHPPHALRDQGPGGDAAEAPHRRRVDRRAHARRRARPQAAQGGRAPHALQPPERDHRRSRKRAMDKLFERGITVRNQSVLQRGVNDTRRRRCSSWSSGSGTQRAPVLRLRARPREGRRGSAHDAADRRSTSRSTCAARRPASTRRRSSSTRPAAAASATRTRSSTTTATTGISVFTAPSVKPGVLPSTSIRSTRCRPRARRAGPTPHEHQPWSKRPCAAATASHH